MVSSVLEIISQEPRPLTDRPYVADWIVHNVHLTPEGYAYGLRASYPFRVDVTICTGERCTWEVPDLRDWRYDLTNASYDTCRVYCTTR